MAGYDILVWLGLEKIPGETKCCQASGPQGSRTGLAHLGGPSFTKGRWGKQEEQHHLGDAREEFAA